MKIAPLLLFALPLALPVCLALAASDGAGIGLGSVPGAGDYERSSLICISPPRCRHVVTHLGGRALELIPASSPASTPTITYRSIHEASEDGALGLPVSLPAPTLQPRDSSSLLETITSLRKALESAGASAESRSHELVTSLDVLRTSSASLAVSASSALLSVQASASNAVAAANASAARAVSAADQSPSDGAQTQDDKMGKKISVPIFVVSIVISVFGSAMISMVALYLFMRHRKTQRLGSEHEQMANAALDRAIVSYIAKECPNPQEGQQPGALSSNQLGRATTTATDATMTTLGNGGALSDAHGSSQESLTASVERRQSLRRTETTITDSTATSSMRKTASSHFMDSAERVYGDILVRPLERISIPGASPTLHFVPPVRGDDVGWPLAKETWI